MPASLLLPRRGLGATGGALSRNCHRTDTTTSPQNFTISAWSPSRITLQHPVFTASTGQSLASRAPPHFMVLSSNSCASCAAPRGQWPARRVACFSVRGRGPGLTGCPKASPPPRQVAVDAAGAVTRTCQPLSIEIRSPESPCYRGFFSGCRF